MAGYVILSPHQVGADVMFHHGEEGLLQKIVSAAGSHTVTLMVDGDELAAVLWGLAEYGKTHLGEKYYEHSVKLNSAAWKIAVALGEIKENQTEYDGDIDDLVKRIIAFAEPAIQKKQELEQELVPGSDGVWLAYHHDWSSASVFIAEIEALRHAVEHGMGVRFWQFNTDNPK